MKNGEFTRSQTMEKETLNVEQIVKHKKFDRETKINYITILLVDKVIFQNWKVTK